MLVDECLWRAQLTPSHQSVVIVACMGTIQERLLMSTLVHGQDRPACLPSSLGATRWRSFHCYAGEQYRQ